MLMPINMESFSKSNCWPQTESFPPKCILAKNEEVKILFSTTGGWEEGVSKCLPVWRRKKKSFEIAFLKVKSYARCTEGIQKGEQETAEIYGTLIRREYIRADKVGLRFTRMDKF